MTDIVSIEKKNTGGVGVQSRRNMTTRARLSQDVFSQIKNKILTSSIVRGERLYETVVSRDYSTSRTPVREALMRLLEEGLLERRGRAYVVREISPLEIIDLYMVRQRLESLSVSTAARSIEEASINKLQSYVDQMEAAVARREKLEFNFLDSQFHMVIAESTGNRVLVELLSGLHEKVMLVRNSMHEFVDRLPSANAEHVLILNALKRREPFVASAEMDAHIQTTIDFLKQMLQSSEMKVKGGKSK